MPTYEELLNENKKLRDEIVEQKKLISAQKDSRESSERSLLQLIGSKLYAEREDFIESIDTPMNEMLGEIYREKLKQVFKILEKEGIEYVKPY